jgi:FG-GAP-like repeat
VPFTDCGELGPAVTRPDGSVVAFGGLCTEANPDPTAIYNPFLNTWVQGPNIPATCGASGTTNCSLADAGGVLLPNGNVLFAASAGFNKPPAHFFEFTTANTIDQVADDYSASNGFGASYVFLVLPTGQILMTLNCNCVEIYTPIGSPDPAWAPTVTSAPPSCVSFGGTYSLSGTQLNGLSQGAAYGDDFQSATNYPLVRIVYNINPNLGFYARTFGHSTMSIAPGQVGSTNFTVPSNIVPGASTLHVIANGIASSGTPITVSASCAGTHDFNGDGRSDIVWRDASGNTAIWLMNGATVLSSGGVGGVPATWSIVGQRDFDGDGKADLLWRDTSGNTSIWFMNGTQVASSAGIGNIPTTWSVVATGDFNGDGKGDILWRDNSGNVAVWMMNGAAVTSSGALGNVPTTWTVVGTGDFNADGKTDLLWRDNLGNTSIWFMNGSQVSFSAGVGNIPTSWSVAGTGDFNGDGKADIVWRDNVGDTSIWLMNGAAVLTAGALGNIPTNWSIVQTGDYNGDSMSDLLWRDSSGNTAMWFMNGMTVSSTGGVGNIPTSWTVQSVNAE